MMLELEIAAVEGIANIAGEEHCNREVMLSISTLHLCLQPADV